LNEDSGIIEWVNKLTGYRNIMLAYWGRKNIQIHVSILAATAAQSP
jgi:hypothetical protein